MQIKHFSYILLTIVVLCSYSYSSSAKIIRYPMCEKSDIPYMQIDSIDLSDVNTLVYCTYNNVMGVGSWVNINNTMHIMPLHSTDTYKIIDSKGIPISPDKYNFLTKIDRLSCVLVFPPLPDYQNINIIEHEGEDGFNFYNVDLTKEGQFVSDSTQKRNAEEFFNNGVEYYKTGQYSKAIESFSHCYEIERKFYDKDDVWMKYTQHWISSALYKDNKIDEAKKICPYFKEAPGLRNNYLALDKAIKDIRDSINYRMTLSNDTNQASKDFCSLMDKVLTHPCSFLYNDEIYNVGMGIISIFTLQSNYANAEPIFNRLSQLSGLTYDEKSKLYYLGTTIFSGLGNEEKILYCLKETEKNLANTTNYKELWDCYHSLCNKLFLKDQTEALNYLHKEEKLIIKLQDSFKAGKIYLFQDYATFYLVKSQEMSDKRKALDYINKACNVPDSLLSDHYVLWAYINALMMKAVILESLGRKDEQINTLIYVENLYDNNRERWIALSDSNDIYRTILYTIGNAYRKTDSNKAIEYYLKSWNVQKDIIKNNIANLPIQKRESYLRKELSNTTNPLYYGLDVLVDNELTSAAYDFTLSFNNSMIDSYKSVQDSTFQIFDLHWQDIAKKLRGGDIAVEFTNFGNEDYYAALVINHYSKYPKVYYLGKYADFDSILKTSLNPDSSEIAFWEIGTKIWGNILRDFNVQNGENIFFHSTGFLSDWPIEDSMVLDISRLSDYYNVYRLSSTERISNLHSVLDLYSNKPIMSQISVYGGLDYDINDDTLSSRDNPQDKKESLFRGEVLNATRGGFDYLRYTSVEADTIAAIFKELKANVCLFKGKNGTEVSFKDRVVSTSSIIHIATHGFYLKPKDESKLNKLNFARYGENIDDELSRAVLVLSGGNRILKNCQGLSSFNDGLLTGEEIQYLDLPNVDLLVLSACNTGVGKSTFVGIAGLQMAFKRAGVKTIIMSQSEVDDKTTLKFMIDFYTNLKLGYTKQKAFKLANQATGRYSSLFTMLDAF